MGAPVAPGARPLLQKVRCAVGTGHCHTSVDRTRTPATVPAITGNGHCEGYGSMGGRGQGVPALALRGTNLLHGHARYASVGVWVPPPCLLTAVGKGAWKLQSSRDVSLRWEGQRRRGQCERVRGLKDTPAQAAVLNRRCGMDTSCTMGVPARLTE